MTCKTIQEELVAYRDGELSEQDRNFIVAHLLTCADCTREARQLAQIEQLLTTMERLTPSPDFAATFWRRLEQEKEQEKAENLNITYASAPRFFQWWRELRETLTMWQAAPILAAAASVLVFFSYLVTVSPTPPSQPPPQTPVTKAAPVSTSEIPAGIGDKLGLFLNYKVIADLDRLSRFDQVAAVELPEEQNLDIAKEEELPPDLLQNPSFFAHYPILNKMDQLQNLEAVLGSPAGEDKQTKG